MSEEEKKDIERNFFSEKTEEFIIHVVEKNFSVNRGYKYFKYYEGKSNYLSSKREVENFIFKIMKWIGKNVPNLTNLVETLFLSYTDMNVFDIITALSKLFSANEHQAVGPDIIDPLILQEGEIKKNEIAHIVALHKQSFLRPTIIILLKDNNFERAKTLLKLCPHGTSIKFIRNSGEIVLDRVVNTGTENINEFLDVYSRQCFNSCSNTERGIIYNEEWAEDNLTKLFAPSILKLRALLLHDNKIQALNELNPLLSSIESFGNKTSKEQNLLLGFQCITKIFRVYSCDYGGKDIVDSMKIAEELENEILLAHVYRYSRFFPDMDLKKQNEYTQQAQNIFSKNGMEDYAVYCNNNLLVTDFYSDRNPTAEFENLFDRAINNVPGLVGLSIIYNNVGVSYLYNGEYDKAIEYFKKGIPTSSNRMAQKVALKSNLLIAKHFAGQEIKEREFQNIIDLILILGGANLDFLASSYLMNILAISLKKNDLFTHLINSNIQSVQKILNNSLAKEKLGSNSLAYQIARLQTMHKEFFLPIEKNSSFIEPLGIRGRHLTVTGINPAIFNAWL